jgi:hypothetical protein
MAQLSTDTLVYTQIVSKVQSFINDYVKNKNLSPQEFDKAYQDLLFDINNNIGGLTADIKLINKGDIPSADIFNKMISALSKDLNIATNQLDTMTAGHVNAFNIFSNQIEAEKNFLTRIKSKITVLEMYSGSSSTDITYLGDSFNDLSHVNASLIRPGLVPDIEDGYATLAKTTTKKWGSSVRVVNQNYNNSVVNEIPFANTSNGLKGNHFIYQNDSDKNQFLYEKDSAILRSSEVAIMDGTPATYFEYEAVKVLNVDSKPDYEFQYLSNGKYINWSDFDTSNPLRLTLEFSSQSKKGEYLNYISIVPFFGYDIPGANALIKNVKITSIKLYDETLNKTYELVNNGPVYIGSDISSKNINNYKEFFYNKGIFRFEEKRTNKVYITFEQPEFNDTVIKHAYWTPYEIGKTEKWNNQSRFQPEAVFSSSIQNVTWDKNSLVPSLDKPTEIKSSASDIRQVTVSYNAQVSSGNKYQIKLTDGTNFYYWIKKDPDTGLDLFGTKTDAPLYTTDTTVGANRLRMIDPDYPAGCVLVNANKADALSALKIRMNTISVTSQVATVTTIGNHGFSQGDKVFIKDRWENVDIWGTFTVTSVDSTTQFKVSTSVGTNIPTTDISGNFGLCVKAITTPTKNNLTIETSTNTISQATKTILNLKRNFEYLKAKRASIGIRDISFGKETFKDAAEIVSKPFAINGQLEMLSLQAADFTEKTDNGQSTIRYYISVDNGVKWIQIQPIQRNFTGVPEVLSFNQNLTGDSTIPQIAYFNVPDVPNPITSVIVKIIMQKDTSLNNTPIVYYYKLAARIR